MKVLDNHRLIIFKVCNTYCRDPEDRKDLVQDIILQLWTSVDKYDEQYMLSTWVYRIALNVAISYYRKATTRGKHLLPLSENFVNIAQDDGNDLSEEMKMLQKMIGRMDDLSKALMILYLDGQSHEEISSILNISKSNVGTKINRIKENLKRQFKKL